jgi:hypothetical protein
MRFAIALAVVLVTPTASAAKPYLSLDLAGERTSGTYHWSRQAIGLSEFSTTVTGYGVSLGGAVGATLASSVSIAAEGSVAYDSGSSDNVQAFGRLAGRARVGFRCELRDEPPFYLRAAFGLEWLGLANSGDDVDQGWEPENMRGLYGALTVGVRTTHLGPFVRAEIAHDTSEHASFTPVTLAIGADLTL